MQWIGGLIAILVENGCTASINRPYSSSFVKDANDVTVKYSGTYSPKTGSKRALGNVRIFLEISASTAKKCFK